MRLYDKCWLQLDSGVRQWFRENAARAAILDIDTIARHHDAVAEAKGTMGPEDYPYARSPWDRVFCEFTLPQLGARWEIGILANRLPFGTKREKTLLDWVKKDKPAEWALEKARNAGDVLHVFFLAWKPGLAPTFQPCEVIVLQDSAGLVNEILFTFFPEDGGTEGIIDTPSESIEFRRSVYTSLIEPMLLAFSFSNCKNVTIEIDTDDPTPAKIRRRLKLPEVKCHSLTIAGHSTKRRRGPCSDHQEGIMPLSLVRGHFRTYTADAPLFGRKNDPRFVGRFWDAPRMRGKKENGQVIITDYTIKP